MGKRETGQREEVPGQEICRGRKMLEEKKEAQEKLPE